VNLTFKEEKEMRINHNIAALNTYRQLGSANNAQQSSMEKLSSGLRINSAKDDAAGLAISEKMRGQIRGLDMASKNAQDGVSLLQTAEGALNETHDILQRMRELAVQGSNGTNEPEDLDAIQAELDELITEVNRIGDATEFNGKKLLDGSLGNTPTLSTDLTVANGINGVKISGTAADTYTLTVADNTDDTKTDITITNQSGVSQTIEAIADPAAGQSANISFDAFGITLEVNSGLNAGVANTTLETITVADGGVDIQIGANNAGEQRLNISIDSMKATVLGTGGVGSGANTGWTLDDVKVNTGANARDSIDVIEKAINTVSKERSKLGAYQNRLDHTINNLGTSSENLTAAESRIRDVDYALAA
jgi:flagellin